MVGLLHPGISQRLYVIEAVVWNGEVYYHLRTSHGLFRPVAGAGVHADFGRGSETLVASWRLCPRTRWRTWTWLFGRWKRRRRAARLPIVEAGDEAVHVRSPWRVTRYDDPKRDVARACVPVPAFTSVV